MSLRIVSGAAKGCRLKAPKGLDIRPTTDRVREALFNILGPRVAGAHFLDLFAGSGANAIEALSRGAKTAIMVDGSAAAIACIEENLAKARLADRGCPIRMQLPRGLKRLARLGIRYDLIFADPPYGYSEMEALLETIVAESLLADSGLLIVEHASGGPELLEIEGLTLGRVEKYGRNALSFFS